MELAKTACFADGSCGPPLWAEQEHAMPYGRTRGACWHPDQTSLHLDLTGTRHGHCRPGDLAGPSVLGQDRGRAAARAREGYTMTPPAREAATGRCPSGAASILPALTPAAWNGTPCRIPSVKNGKRQRTRLNTGGSDRTLMLPTHLAVMPLFKHV